MAITSEELMAECDRASRDAIAAGSTFYLCPALGLDAEIYEQHRKQKQLRAMRRLSESFRLTVKES